MNSRLVRKPSAAPLRRGKLRGVTLVELLVVMGTIAILIGIALPGMAYARFTSRVSHCGNNFRQIGIASHSYATEDSLGRWPSFTLPIASSPLAGYPGIRPTYVSGEMIVPMERLGVAPKLWFCSLRPYWEISNANFRRTFDRDISTGADLVDSFKRGTGSIVVALDTFWWVPRPLEGVAQATFPDTTASVIRTSDPWPERLDQSSTTSRPLASDDTVGGGISPGGKVATISGGHRFSGRVRSSNALFPDGHVETKSVGGLTWEIANPSREFGYMY